MKNWQEFFKKNDGNQFPHNNLVIFFFKYIYKIKKIKEKHGFGVVLNTSFNLHGRTNVLRPEDAIVDFLDCNLDQLYINGYKVIKKI